MDWDPQDNQNADHENLYQDYYSTGGGCRPPKRPKNHGATIAILGAVLLCLAAGVGLSRGAGRIRAVPDAVGSAQESAEVSSVRLETEPVSTQDGHAVNVETAAPETIQPSPSARSSSVHLTVSAQKSSSMELTELYKKLIPSVVSITASSNTAKTTGTGIVMSQDGYIITNQHVVSGAKTISVLLSDDTEYLAELVGGDETSDLAVLKIPVSGLTPAEFGDSESLEVGESVVAIGDPLGTELRGTMTNGIICGINRDVQVGDRSMTLIQTNAALNSGNSGGPLVNLAGQVVGINTIKLRSSYNAVEGIGFAIPSSTAAPIIDELVEKGYVSGRPAFGFTVETLSMQMRLFYNLPGVLCISSVEHGSDAWEQGVSVGDIILAVEGEAVATMDEFNTIKNRHSAGDSVTLTLYRKGEELEVTVKLMDRATLD